MTQPNELELLITELQRELDFLKAETERCVQERDFLSAHYFSTACAPAERHIARLRSLHQANFKKQNSLESTVDLFKRAYQNAEGDLKNYFLNRMLDAVSELKKLAYEKKPFFVDGEEILTALETMQAGATAAVEIQIREKPGWRLVLSRLEKGLRINVLYTSIDQHPYTRRQELIQLQRIGFQVNNEAVEMVIPDNPKPLRVLEILARVCFEGIA